MHASSSAGAVADAPDRHAPLRKANTTSDRLDLLRRARDKMAVGGSQLPADAVDEAESILHDMYHVLQRARTKHVGRGKTAQGR